MSDLPTESSTTAVSTVLDPSPTEDGSEAPPTEEELKNKYVKYAMRNMVKKRGKSLQHFALSTIGLLALFIGLSYLTR
jgi:Protein of unknown function (DUF3285)